MANLIITIIAIALVAVAALMGAYYGGTAFNQGQDKAKATTIVNQAAQIQAAAQMYYSDEGAWPASMATLTGATPPYLASAPSLSGATWALVSNQATLSGGTPAVVTTAVCDEIPAIGGMQCNGGSTNTVVYTF